MSCPLIVDGSSPSSWQRRATQLRAQRTTTGTICLDDASRTPPRPVHLAKHAKTDGMTENPHPRLARTRPGASRHDAPRPSSLPRKGVSSRSPGEMNTSNSAGRVASIASNRTSPRMVCDGPPCDGLRTIRAVNPPISPPSVPGKQLRIKRQFAQRCESIAAIDHHGPQRADRNRVISDAIWLVPAYSGHGSDPKKTELLHQSGRGTRKATGHPVGDQGRQPWPTKTRRLQARPNWSSHPKHAAGLMWIGSGRYLSCRSLQDRRRCSQPHPSKGDVFLLMLRA
jgi:hypothetical protein